MGRFRLTHAADRDFENILEFGIDRFGINQALDYQDGLKAQLNRLANQPDLYQAVDHVRAGYRRCVYKSHSIYYKIEDSDVIIVRILGSENPETSFSS